MNLHKIDFNSVIPKGKVVTETKNNELIMTATFQCNKFDKFLDPIVSYVYLPDRYKLPLRIDIEVKIDSPAFYFILGTGHLTFGDNDNRVKGDIVLPDNKPHGFNNQINFNEYTKISIIYDYKFMQIVVNKEMRYYSKKEKYMKSPDLLDLNNEGFQIKLACSKHTNMTIKSLLITEFGDETPNLIETKCEKFEKVETPLETLTFETLISTLPKELSDEIIKTDAYLLSMLPMKFKRKLDERCNKITYISSQNGFSYAFYIRGNIVRHTMWWYILYNCKPDDWHRKDDMMEATLKKLAQTSPELADQIFSRLEDCVNCSGDLCKVKTKYKFNGKIKLSCHGRIQFKMIPSEFNDARKVIDAVNSLVVLLE